MSAWTLGFQIANFVVLAALLRRFLFRPITAMIAERQRSIEHAVSEGQRVQQEAAQLHVEAEQTLTQAREERSQVLAELRAELGRERDAALATARREAQALIDAGQSNLEAERERAAAGLEQGALELAMVITRRLLEQVASAPIAEAFLERLCQHLDGLSEERRSSLRDELRGSELLVATAPPLSPQIAGPWLTRIETRLATGASLRLVSDESLLAGVELRFPYTTLSFCWRDVLESAGQELIADDRPR